MAVIGFKRKPTHVQLPESFLRAQEAFGMQPVGFPVGFSLHRRRDGTEVWLHFQNGLRLNLTTDQKVRPQSFKEARIWCQRFADAHGFTPREVPWFVASSEGQDPAPPAATPQETP